MQTYLYYKLTKRVGASFYTFLAGAHKNSRKKKTVGSTEAAKKLTKTNFNFSTDKNWPQKKQKKKKRKI